MAIPTKDYHIALRQSGAIKLAADGRHLFELRSGKRSWVYVDHGELLCQPETFWPYISMLTNYFRETYPPEVTLLANVDSKSSPHIVGALATMGLYRQVVVSPEAIRHAEKGPGLSMRLPCRLEPVEDIVIVDDVFTVGDTTAMRILSRVKDALCSRLDETVQHVKYHVVVGLLRGDPQAAAEQFGQLGADLHWFVTLDEVLVPLRPMLSPEQRAGLGL